MRRASLITTPRQAWTHIQKQKAVVSKPTTNSWLQGIKATQPAKPFQEPVTGQRQLRDWHLMDAKGEVVGRLAARVAILLQGKHKPYYSMYNGDQGDHVVVVNVDKPRFTGNKYVDKKYHWHTQWPGGLHSITPRQLSEVKLRPDRMLQRAIYGMLPKNKLRSWRMERLHLIPGPQHEYFDRLPQLSDIEPPDPNEPPPDPEQTALLAAQIHARKMGASYRQKGQGFRRLR